MKLLLGSCWTKSDEIPKAIERIKPPIMGLAVGVEHESHVNGVGGCCASGRAYGCADYCGSDIDGRDNDTNKAGTQDNAEQTLLCPAPNRSLKYLEFPGR
jgi:hypothetical protein